MLNIKYYLNLIYVIFYCQLDNLLSGGSWVKFENVDQAKGKVSPAKKHGKY